MKKKNPKIKHGHPLCSYLLLYNSFFFLNEISWTICSTLLHPFYQLHNTSQYNFFFNGCFLTQFSSVAQSCLTLCNSMTCSMPGFPVHHQLPELAQTHVHWVGDAIQPSHTLSSPSPPDLNLSQHQGLFQWVSSLHHVAIVLEFQLQHQPFQWIFRVDFL